MKRILLTLVTITTIALSSFGQAPEGFKYQAVVRDAGNFILTNQAVGMQMTIQQGSIGGTTVYQETFAPTTNTYGLVNLEIGNGTVVSGDFTTIDWSAGPYYIETAVDVSGGTNYAVMGTSQLMSVPYALYAKTSGNGQGPVGPQGATGAQGPAGNDGAVGATGAQGPQGIPGIQGATGPQGLTGPAGANGIDGTDGVDGIDGAAGATGPQGPIGLTGPAGANGIDGTDGVDGVDGAPGATGPQGPIGLTGPTGANGIDGVDGTDCCNAIDSLTQLVSTLDSIVTVFTSQIIFGCMDNAAINYNPLANFDDGSCTYPFSGAIGDTYQGGIVFWLDGNGGGLIAAPTDQAIGVEWGCYGNAIAGADGTAIGTGAQNTIDIETGCTSSGIAADLCANLTLGGYSDWFLPSKDELTQMYFNLHQQGLGGFSDFYYWSSSEAASNNAWVRRFANGYLDVANKNLTTLYVRAVRAF
ncbi:MAG: DUF1566 domain-containing protein [Crocinitomicaceae bacterium]|nr:DUF1566 domain-containing protein [Crocinitomicaceae bacterium]